MANNIAQLHVSIGQLLMIIWWVYVREKRGLTTEYVSSDENGSKLILALVLLSAYIGSLVYIPALRGCRQYVSDIY